MKKLLSVLLAVMMLLGVCAAAVADEDTTFRVALITDTGGIHDQSFNELAWTGLSRAQDELGFTVQYYESTNSADYTTNLELAYDEGYDLIIVNGYLMADAIAEACEEHPEQLYAIIDSGSCAENCVGIQFATEQNSYLMGIAAAMMSETGHVGFIIGMVSPTMNTFGLGYYAGALSVNPDIVIDAYNANSFTDSAAGKAAAIDMYANGADVIFQAAGGVGTGAIDAAKEQGKYIIGVDKDQNYLAPDNVIASALKKVDAGVFTVCQQLADGTLAGGDVYYDLTSGSVGYASTGDLMTAETIEAMDAAAEAIKDGTLVVPSTVADFEAIYGAGVYPFE